MFTTINNPSAQPASLLHVLLASQRSPGLSRHGRCGRCPGDRHEIAVAAGELRGVKQLGGKSPKCMVVNKWSCPQIDAPLNKETVSERVRG